MELGTAYIQRKRKRGLKAHMVRGKIIGVGSPTDLTETCGNEGSGRLKRLCRVLKLLYNTKMAW